MAKTKVDKLGSARRFGSRYGTKPKHKFAKIEKEHRKKHKCPYCNAVKVKRQAAGIWLCMRCNTKFTGKAYTIKKTVFVEEAAPKEDPLEKMAEEEQDEDYDEDDSDEEQESSSEEAESDEASEEEGDESSEETDEKKNEVSA